MQTFKQLFKDKVDWKCYNLLKYILTKFEDSGASLSLYISINNCFPILIYNSDFSSEIWRNTHKPLEEVEELYNKNGLVYVVEVEKEMNEKWLTLMQNIKEKILETGKVTFQADREGNYFYSLEFLPKD